jgi:hypothetical protein
MRENSYHGHTHHQSKLTNEQVFLLYQNVSQIKQQLTVTGNEEKMPWDQAAVDSRKAVVEKPHLGIKK